MQAAQSLAKQLAVKGRASEVPASGPRSWQRGIVVIRVVGYQLPLDDAHLLKPLCCIASTLEPALAQRLIDAGGITAGCRLHILKRVLNRVQQTVALSHVVGPPPTLVRPSKRQRHRPSRPFLPCWRPCNKSKFLRHCHVKFAAENSHHRSLGTRLKQRRLLGETPRYTTLLCRKIPAV